MDNPKPSDPDRLYTERQVAELTSISYRSLQGWRLRGGGPPYIKCGRSVRYRAGDLKAWCDRHRRMEPDDVEQA